MRYLDLLVTEASRPMADKIAGNVTQGKLGTRAGDVFLDILANDPNRLIDKKDQPMLIPNADQLLKIAQDYQTQNQQPITTDLAVWKKTLTDLGITQTVLNRLKKTPEFGASDKEKYAKQIQPAAVFGDKEVGGDEVKDLDTAIANSSIPGDKLADEVIGSSVLNDKKNQLGPIVVEIAKNLKAGKNEVPQGDWLKNSQALKAIQDYAGEYLGVIALIHDVANFPNKSAFFRFMNTNSLAQLNYYFPSKTNMPLADSFGTITNRKDASIMNISSKGGTTGAAPSLTNLQINDKTKNNPQFKNEVEFIEAVIDPSEFEGAFRLYNVLYDQGGTSKKGLDQAKQGARVEKFSDQDIAKLNQIFKERKQSNPKEEIKKIQDAGFGEYLADLQKLNPETKVKNPIGYLYYFTQKLVIEAVNKNGALPNFQQCVREVLGDNFMQIITKVTAKGIKVNVLYPARINGNVILSTGSGQGTFAGKLGFKIVPGKGYF